MEMIRFISSSNPRNLRMEQAIATDKLYLKTCSLLIVWIEIFIYFDCGRNSFYFHLFIYFLKKMLFPTK